MKHYKQIALCIYCGEPGYAYGIEQVAMARGKVKRRTWLICANQRCTWGDKVYMWGVEHNRRFSSWIGVPSALAKRVREQHLSS